ncbi:hypothetical protein KUV23_03020 [Algoriphagus marincola]|uniref:Capsule polysaccharide biosynthesis protein n=1 Tax=Algoriphagus marincola TaxID=264027 RepID=A0ABS7N0V1_9BACT|nr:hypothetical protein [Algoriphagus marincola]MBY5949927.1 hypothetical protein [Algoriphagus marincola]
MKKEIYFFYSSLPGSMFGVLLDQAKKAIMDEKKKIYFVMCQGFFSHCLSNPKGNLGICELCKFQTKHLLSDQLGKEVTFINLSDHYSETHSLEDIQINSSKDVKRYKYKGIEIGYGVLSSYIYITRNQNPKVDDKSKVYFQNQILQSIKLIDAFEAIITGIQPDEISSFNGRFNEIKPVFELAIQKKIPVNLYEFESVGYKKYAKVVFKNTLPHSVSGNRWKFDYLWNEPSLTKDKKVALSKEFYQNKRLGKAAGDKVYVKGMPSGVLPDNWDTIKRNIVLFNSSEDEFVSIGKEWEDLALFDSQFDGMVYIFEKYKEEENTHFYLRIHPNLKNVPYRYHTDLYNLEKKYKNVTVIGPKSNISTYDLIDASDLVIVFGSTVGLEASYSGKPVILLGCSWYYYENVCYVPRSIEEFDKLFQKELLPIKNEEMFLKLGLFFYYRNATHIDKETLFKYIDFNITVYRFFGKEVYGYNYQKIFFSKKIYALGVAFVKAISLLLLKNKFVIPLNEE